MESRGRTDGEESASASNPQNVVRHWQEHWAAVLILGKSLTLMVTPTIFNLTKKLNPNYFHVIILQYEAAVLSKDVKDMQVNIPKTWTKYNTSSKVQQCLDLSPMDLILVCIIILLHFSEIAHEIYSSDHVRIYRFSPCEWSTPNPSNSTRYGNRSPS